MREEDKEQADDDYGKVSWALVAFLDLDKIGVFVSGVHPNPDQQRADVLC